MKILFTYIPAFSWWKEEIRLLLQYSFRTVHLVVQKGIDYLVAIRNLTKVISFSFISVFVILPLTFLDWNKNKQIKLICSLLFEFESCVAIGTINLDRNLTG